MYERLLGDAMDGDAMLFAREDGVGPSYQGLLGNVVPALDYGTKQLGPVEGMKLAVDIGG